MNVDFEFVRARQEDVRREAARHYRVMYEPPPRSRLWFKTIDYIIAAGNALKAFFPAAGYKSKRARLHLHSVDRI